MKSDTRGFRWGAISVATILKQVSLARDGRPSRSNVIDSCVQTKDVVYVDVMVSWVPGGVAIQFRSIVRIPAVRRWNKRNSYLVEDCLDPVLDWSSSVDA